MEVANHLRLALGRARLRNELSAESAGLSSPIPMMVGVYTILSVRRMRL
jgi:hypothetical protein